jgi:hypothetical protein
MVSDKTTTVSNNDTTTTTAATNEEKYYIYNIIRKTSEKVFTNITLLYKYPNQ